MRRSFVFGALALLLSAPFAFHATPCSAALQRGDVLVASIVYGQGGPVTLWQLASATLDTTRLSTGGLLGNPRQLALAPDGTVLVADEVSGLLRIDPGSGAQQLLAGPASLGGDPGGVLVAPTGQVYLSLSNAGVGSIIEVTLAGERVRVVTSGDHLASPASLVMAPAGELYVAEPARPAGYPGPYGSIVRVDPASGAQSVLVAGGFMYGPFDLALTPSGVLYAAHRGTLSGRQAVFTRTSIVDGSTERDPEMLDVVSCFVASAGTEDPYLNTCFTISYTCYTPTIAPRSAGWYGPPRSPTLTGPMVVVTDAATPVRGSSWGSLKVRYR